MVANPAEMRDKILEKVQEYINDHDEPEWLTEINVNECIQTALKWLYKDIQEIEV